MSGSPQAPDQDGRGANTSRPPTLELRNIVKSFTGQVAVDDVSFSVGRGEIHGLVGENGAGKSTLIKVLAGEYQADSGTILLDGSPYVSHHPSEAAEHGIGFIHQVPALVPALSVAENVTLGLGYRRNRLGFISWAQLYKNARSVLAKVGLSDLDPRQPLERLSLHQRQLVAVARVLTIDLRAVVFDEVTAPLAKKEVERLFRIIREIQSAGVGIIYISHRLGEVFELADRVTVMKNGRHVETSDISNLTPASLTRLIIGKDPSERFKSAPPVAGTEPVLSIKDMSDEVLRNVSFDLHAGEILGIAGLGGSGRSNIVGSIFGARQPDAGQMLLDGSPVRFHHPSDAVAHGIALVTEDRHNDGIIGDAPIWQNITLPWLSRFSRWGFLPIDRERRRASALMKEFDIRARSMRVPLRELSGGNQQKTILAKWLAEQLKVLLLDEPTHGVDVGAKEQIYEILRGIAEEGVPVIMISSEFAELEGMCTRVLLLVEGTIVEELSGDDITESNILSGLYAQR